MNPLPVVKQTNTFSEQTANGKLTREKHVGRIMSVIVTILLIVLSSSRGGDDYKHTL